LAKSSLDYSELSGLNIALKNLEVVKEDAQDHEWLTVTSWIQSRIKQLQNK
jgi:hypothetical protein